MKLRKKNDGLMFYGKTYTNSQMKHGVTVAALKNPRHVESRFKGWYYGDFKDRFNKCFNRAVRKKIIFNLDLEELLQRKFVCHYTGLSLTEAVGFYNTVSFDRLDSSDGYTKKNTVLCCSIINDMKGTLSKKDFIKFCKLVSIHKN
jgi:hypothetical protein